MQTVSLDETKNTVVLRAEHHDEEGRKAVDYFEFKTRNPERIKQVEKKLMEKGLQRMERHPSDRMEDYEMQPAMDEGDPNYDEEQTKKKIGGEGSAGRCGSG